MNRLTLCALTSLVILNISPGKSAHKVTYPLESPTAKLESPTKAQERIVLPECPYNINIRKIHNYFIK